MTAPPAPERSPWGRRLRAAALRFLTPERIRNYPAIGFAVMLAVAVYDRLSGRGLVNGLAGPFGGDFLSFYTAGALLLRGTPEALADVDAQLAFQRSVLGTAVDSVAVWVSPPYFAWAFVPFAALPYTFAVIVFFLANLGLFLLSFRLLARELRLPLSAAAMLWIALQYYPTINALLNGQMSALWLLVFCGVFVALRRGQDIRAGLLLGLFACKPPLAFGLGMALLAAGRFRALFAAAGSSLTLLGVGYLTLPAAMDAYFTRADELVSLVRGAGYNTAGLHGSFELATLLLDGVSRPVATVAGVATMCALIGLIGASWLGQPWVPRTRAWDLTFAGTFALGVIASPHLFAYDLTLLFLPLFVAVAHYPVRQRRPLGGGALLVSTALVWSLGLLGPVFTALQQELTRRTLGFAAALQVGVLAILLWAMDVVRMREGRR